MSTVTYLAASVPLRLASAGTVVALPVLAVERLDDVALGGLLAGTALFPAIIAAPFVGTVLDRLRHPRRLLVAAAVVTAVGYTIGAMLGVLPVVLVAAVLVATGLATPVYMGGMSSFVTSAIPDARRAYAQDSLSYTIASISGPALAAIAIAVDSARAAMLVMAAFALVGVIASLGLRMEARPAPRLGVGRTIAAGIAHLVRHRPIAVVTLAGTISQIGGGALGVTAIALSIERVGSTAASAWIVTAFAVGGLGGALAVAARRWTAWSPPFVMGAGFAATGVCILVAAPDLGIVVVVAAVAVAGVFTAPANAAMLLLRDRESPPEVKSQVFTIGAGLRAAAAAVGATLAGAVSGLAPASVIATWLVVGIAAVWIVSGAMLALFPRARAGDRPGVDHPAASAR